MLCMLGNDWLVEYVSTRSESWAVLPAFHVRDPKVGSERIFFVLELVLNRYRSFTARRGLRWSAGGRNDITDALQRNISDDWSLSQKRFLVVGFFQETRSQVHVNDRLERFCFDFRIVSSRFYRWMHCHYLVVVSVTLSVCSCSMF
jgi:hypothetical protein